MSPSYRNAVNSNVNQPQKCHLVQKRPSNEAVLKILELHETNAPREDIRDAILRACPLPPPTVDLVLETKYDLRAVPYNTILESLATDQVDNKELHDLLMKDVTEIVKRNDGALVLKVTSAASREALSKHRVKLCGSEYAFKTDEVLDQRFFFDVVNFSYDDGIPALIDQLLETGFKLTSCAKKINLASSNLSTPMLRVFTADLTIPDVALVNGSPMDQIAFNGKAFMVNCKGSRSGANPRTRSPQCLDLNTRSQEPPAQNPADDVVMDEFHDDATTSRPAPTPVELARTHAPNAAYPPLMEKMAWEQRKPRSRLSPRLRTAPALQVQWVDENKFAVLDDMDLETEAYTWAADPAGPPVSLFIQGHRLSPPSAEDLATSCSYFPIHEIEDETGRCTISAAPATMGDFDHAIETYAMIDGKVLAGQMTSELLDIRDIDLRFRSDPSYDAVEQTFRTKPIAANIAMLSYIRMKDPTLDDIIGMHMFARGLATKSLEMGTSYADEYFALLPQSRELRRDPAQQWMRQLSAMPQPNAQRIKVNKALALFELLLRGSAPGLERCDELLMLLSGAQIHWLPTKEDRFLHPATLLAIAATDTGRMIIDVGLANDSANEDLLLLQECLADDTTLAELLEHDLAIEVTAVDGHLTSRTVPGIAQY